MVRRLLVAALFVIALYACAFAFLAFHEAGGRHGMALPGQQAGHAR